VADYEAVVEISTGGSTFKVSGAAAFVEKMIESLPALYPASAATPESKPGEPEKKPDGTGGANETLDDFVARVHMTNAIGAVRKVAAFIFYLTEVKKKPSCTRAEIENCFDVTGLTTPNNLHTVINDAAKERNGAFVRSVSTGNYGVTTKGKNLVKDMSA